MNTEALILITGIQILYSVAFVALGYLITRPVNWVNVEEAKEIPQEKYPYIVLLYPVLRELDETMRTTMLGLAKLDYPKDKFRVVAIPNDDDLETVGHLHELAKDFSFLEVMLIPATSSPQWDVVWKAWEENAEATWWHEGVHKGVKKLPPKKTRQMVFAFYTLIQNLKNDTKIGDWLLDYIDADSVPSPDHFLAAAAGMQHYDVLQSTNIAGNLLQTYPASWCAMDHLNWDYNIYPHMSADGKHPFWVLGKGLFYKSSDLNIVGGFDPWIAIEDPDIGLRLWAKGKTIGIIPDPLIEEVPITMEHCITQRKRWFCGFLQSTFGPGKLRNLKLGDKMKAYLNLVPILSLAVNGIGLPIGIWTLYAVIFGGARLLVGLSILSGANIICYMTVLGYFYISAWKHIGQVVDNNWDKVRFLFRVNPFFLWLYWLIWIVPMFMGFKMFIGDGGLVWQRTEKIDANHSLVRQRIDILMK